MDELTTLWWRLVLVALTLPALAMAACGDGKGGGASAACPRGAVTIAMEGQSFKPYTATAKVGQKICWPNESVFTHDVVARSGADFKSHQYDEGEKPFTTTLEQPGRVDYLCTLHPGMGGVVEVTR